MSVRYYCDGCGAELAPGEDRRLRRALQIGGHLIEVEVMTAVDRTWNDGNVCHNCVRRVANEGKVP